MASPDSAFLTRASEAAFELGADGHRVSEVRITVRGPAFTDTGATPGPPRCAGGEHVRIAFNGDAAEGERLVAPLRGRAQAHRRRTGTSVQRGRVDLQMLELAGPGAPLMHVVDLYGDGERATEAQTPTGYAPDEYRRLAALKSRLAPSNLFRFNLNISPRQLTGASQESHISYVR